MNAALIDNAHGDMAGLAAAVTAVTAALAGLICAAIDSFGEDAPRLLRLAGVTMAEPAELPEAGPFLIRLLAKIERDGYRERMH